MAGGADKAAAVYQMLYAKTTSYIPAAFLQVPLNVTVLLDEAAAEKLCPSQSQRQAAATAPSWREPGSIPQ